MAAVKASAAACLAKKDLSPANCPNRAGNGGFRIEKPTIKWTKRGGTDPFANLQPRLDYESPNIAEVRPSLMLTVRANCSSPTGRCESLTYSGKSATVDMLKEPLVRSGGSTDRAPRRSPRCVRRRCRNSHRRPACPGGPGAARRSAGPAR